MQLKKNILVPLHMSQGTKSSSTGSEMLSSLFLSPQIQDGDHYVKRPPPRRKSPACHNHHVVETFFSEPWNLEYISITNLF